MRDGGDDEKGLVLPKFFKPILSSAVLAVAGAAFQMYTKVELIEQNVAGMARQIDKRDDRVDARLDKQDQRISGIEHEQKEFNREAMGKLDYIADRHRK